MEEILEKRYLLEKGYNEGLIEDTNFSDIDYADLVKELKSYYGQSENYGQWLKQFVLNKKTLGQKMRLANAIGCKGMTEISESAKITACQNRCKNDKVIVLQAGIGKIEFMPTISPDCLLVMGGIFPNQLELTAQVINNGSFSIGYCGKKDAPYTKYVFEQLSLLKEQLLSLYGNQINNLFESKKDYLEDNASVYMIKHRAEPVFRNYEHYNTIPSQR